MCVCVCVDDSDEDREVSRKVRTVRQAATKAVSKQREILLGDAGSEDEEQEDQEEAYNDRMSHTRTHTNTAHTCTLYTLSHTGFDARQTLKRSGECVQTAPTNAMAVCPLSYRSTASR